MVNGWRITAIIFVIISILEFLFIGWIFSLGTEMIEQENECSINVCSDYSSFYFDYDFGMCYCYENGEIVYEEYIK